MVRLPVQLSHLSMPDIDSERRENEWRQQCRPIERNRSTVSLTVGKLDAAGLIEYRQGKMRIREREGLLNSTCECYANINNSSRRITETCEFNR